MLNNDFVLKIGILTSRSRFHQRKSYLAKFSRQFSSISFLRIGINPSKTISAVKSRRKRQIRPLEEQMERMAFSATNWLTVAVCQFFFVRTKSLAPTGSWPNVLKFLTVFIGKLKGILAHIFDLAGFENIDRKIFLT